MLTWETDGVKPDGTSIARDCLLLPWLLVLRYYDLTLATWGDTESLLDLGSSALA